MIARLWSAHTTPALSDSYLSRFEQAVQPRLRELNGFLGATVCARREPHTVEILVTTFWESLAAIDAFAGPDRESAVVSDEAAALLTDFDRRARHYDLVFAKFPANTLHPRRQWPNPPIPQRLSER
jgi:heme-degrading monooxygenase HmoA